MRFVRRSARLRELRDGFLLMLAAEGRSPATLSWYRARLDRLTLYLHDAPANEVAGANIRSWLVAVKQGTAAPVSDSYVESHRKAAATLFSWALREGLTRANPMQHVRPYRIERHELAIFSIDQIRALLASQPTDTFNGRRNRTMIALLYDTGIRVGELVTIETADLDLAGGTVRVRGKARKDRRVPISMTMRSALWRFLEERPDGSTRLFTSREGEQLMVTSVNQWLRRAGRVAGIADVRCSPHTFRHSFATAYLRNGGDEFTLQAILGHSTLEMVRRYVHLASGDVAARHAIASPLERLSRGGAA